METKNIAITVAVGIALLCVGLLFGGKFGATSNFVCNGGTVSGGSTSIPQGSISQTSGGESGLKFGATSGTESFSQAGGNLVTGNTSTTIANTTGNIISTARNTPTSTLSFATSTCIQTVSRTGQTVWWTVESNPGSSQGLGWASSTTIGCQ